MKIHTALFCSNVQLIKTISPASVCADVRFQQNVVPTLRRPYKLFAQKQVIETIICFH